MFDAFRRNACLTQNVLQEFLAKDLERVKAQALDKVLRVAKEELEKELRAHADGMKVTYETTADGKIKTTVEI